MTNTSQKPYNSNHFEKERMIVTERYRLDEYYKCWIWDIIGCLSESNQWECVRWGGGRRQPEKWPENEEREKAKWTDREDTALCWWLAPGSYASKRYANSKRRYQCKEIVFRTDQKNLALKEEIQSGKSSYVCRENSMDKVPREIGVPWKWIKVKKLASNKMKNISCSWILSIQRKVSEEEIWGRSEYRIDWFPQRFSCQRQCQCFQHMWWSWARTVGLRRWTEVSSGRKWRANRAAARGQIRSTEDSTARRIYPFLQTPGQPAECYFTQISDSEAWDKG